MYFDQHPISAGALWTLIAIVALASLVVAQATGDPAFPAGTRISILSPDTFRAVHHVWFEKNPAQAGRVISAVAFTISFHRLLGLNWPLVDHLFGRILVPLGQSSLYVFLVHVPLIAVADQLPGYFNRPLGYSPDTVWLNTLVLCALIATLWLMVRNKVLFGIIPR